MSFFHVRWSQRCSTMTLSLTMFYNLLYTIVLCTGSWWLPCLTLFTLFSDLEINGCTKQLSRGSVCLFQPLIVEPVHYMVYPYTWTKEHINLLRTTKRIVKVRGQEDNPGVWESIDRNGNRVEWVKLPPSKQSRAVEQQNESPRENRVGGGTNPG